MNEDFAIVFVGNNVFYHLGIFKAIEECNLYNKFKATCGVGIGALSSILFAKHNYNSFKELCEIIHNEKNVYLNKEEIYNVLNMHTVNKNFHKEICKWSEKISKEGMLSWNSLLKVINNKKLHMLEKDFNMECYLCCYELPFMRKVMFELNGYDNSERQNIILNSVAQPIIFNNNVRRKTLITGDVDFKIALDGLYNNYKNIILVSDHPISLEKEEIKNYNIIETSNTYISEEFNNNKKYKYVEQGYIDGINFIKNNLRIIA